MTIKADKFTRASWAASIAAGALQAIARAARHRLRGARSTRAIWAVARPLAGAAYRRLLSSVPDTLFLWLSHRRRVGRFPSLKHPVTYNDYILRRCLYPEPHWTALTDKLAVREYIKNKIGEKYLIPLIAAPEAFTQAVFDALPPSFVMKANHGCGFVEIVRDKSKTSFDALSELADRWLTSNYYRQSRERHYCSIKPRLYFETLLLEADGKIPADVKMNMFGQGPVGPIIYTGIVADRFGASRGDVFDVNWNRVELAVGHYPRSAADVPCPENWAEIVDVATHLADGLGYLRVDLYNVAGRIYFGELTFTPGAGVFPFHPDRIDYEWGALLKRMEPVRGPITAPLAAPSHPGI